MSASEGIAAKEKSGVHKIPLYARVLGGVALGIGLGIYLGTSAQSLGDVGKLIIQLLKTLATPLILLAVIDTILQTSIPVKQGARLIALYFFNAAVAVTIGLTVAHAIKGGEQWKGHLDQITASVQTKGPKVEVQGSLDIVKNVSAYIPENIVDPFQKNNVITVVLLAILTGAALRSLKGSHEPSVVSGIKTIENAVHAAMRACTLMLEWIVFIIPIAIVCIIAQVVGKTGIGVFQLLGIFLVTVLLGLFLHTFVYYSFVVWIVARRSPFAFFKSGADAIITALSSGSSLATLPVTLRCLDKNLHVSEASARLAACVGTNLNNDGIILYEAAATIFVCQALGYDLSIAQQVAVAVASGMAAVGIAGVPDAGWITLPLVLSVAGVSIEQIALVTPLLFTVDWLVGRCRAATNVIADMTGAVVLDRFERGDGIVAADTAPVFGESVEVPLTGERQR